MKKCVLIFALLLTFFPLIRTEAASVDENISAEDVSFLTLDVLDGCTWEDLSSTTANLSKEDELISRLIPYLNDMGVGLGGIPLEEVDFERLVQKVEKVVTIYNLAHENQFFVDAYLLNEMCGQISVHCMPEEVQRLNAKIHLIGQAVQLKQDEITYWESSQNMGSGKSGTLKKSDGLTLTVTGVSYLDPNGNITSSVYGKKERIYIGKTHMLHISIDGTDLAWVNSDDLISVD